ncbi:MAG: DUF3108 domain-containing protein [Deltaproteobacteria bacterium]
MGLFKKISTLVSAVTMAVVLIFVSGSFGAEFRALPQPGIYKEAANVAEAFVDEELVYKIGFWLFDDVAEGVLTLKAGENGEYIATLNAYTTGVVDTLLRHRKDIYVAHLVLADGGRRFISKRFEKRIEMDGKKKTSITVIDYDKREIRWTSTETGKDNKSGSNPIPPGIYADGPLAAFYNFRYGVYGPIKEDTEYKILTFPKEDHVPEIYLKIAAKDEMAKRVRSAKERRAADMLADVRLDKELFGSQTGNVEILFSDDMVPVVAVAKDLVLFGDVRGRLVRIGLGMNMRKTSVMGK